MSRFTRQWWTRRGVAIDACFGIVGLGAFGETYLACLNSLRDAADIVVTAVSSHSPERARTLAHQYDVPRWYVSASDLAADPEVDVVCVVTVEHEHCDPVLTCLRAGKDVIVEKPLATSLDHADAMIRAAAQHNRRLMVAQILRFDVLYQTVVERVCAGDIGPVVSVQTRRNRPAEATQRYRRTHPFLETGILDVDVMLWVTQSRVQRVRAFTRTINPGPTPDLAWGILEFESGALGYLETNWLAPSSAGSATDDALNVVGRLGSARVDLSRAPVSIWTERGSMTPDVFYEPRNGKDIGGALREELMYFVGCIRGGKEPARVPIMEVRHGLEVAVGLIRSATEGREIVFEEDGNRQ